MSNLPPTTEVITINAMANGPDAIGQTPTGETVFVPFALPGERVQVQFTKGTGRLKWASLVDVLDAAAGRVKPRCQHFGVCGGCHWQHANDATQQRLKRDIVIDQLQRIGDIDETPVAETIAAPAMWGYRQHLQLTQGENGLLGFETLDGLSVFAPEECPITAPALLEVYRQIDFEAMGEVGGLHLRLGDDDEVMVILETDSPTPPAVELDTEVSVVSIDAEDNTVVIAGAEALMQTVNGRALLISAGGAVITYPQMAGVLVDTVLAALDLQPDDVLFDVFCGSGLLLAFAAPQVARAIGFEDLEGALSDAQANLDEFGHVALYTGPLVHSVIHAPDTPTKLILSPGLDGAGKEMIAAVLARKPARVVYVSNDPASLARDAQQMLAGGYQLAQVQPLDMYPQTHFVVSIAMFLWLQEN